ncbi:MAG: hypothetical protein HYX74_01975 [Acidobacteria bacterium]|nr:hypothetical protein [Acidobacteriota bacterium]
MLIVAALAVFSFLHEDPNADRLVRQAMHATYDLQLEEARRAIGRLVQLHPDHPAGYVLAAETYWWEAQADAGNTEIDEAYDRAQGLALQKAEEALRKGSYARLDLLGSLASAYGSYARFQLTQRAAYFSALRAGLKAHTYALQVHQIDKAHFDIYTGLGAFNYFTGALPAVIRPLAYLIGARGDRHLGLQQLRLAIERSRYGGTEAQIVYYSALLQEKRYAESLKILKTLLAQFEHNHVFLTWLANWFVIQGLQEEGTGHFERASRRLALRSPAMASHALVEKAELELALGKRAAARLTLRRIRDLQGEDRYLPHRLAALEKELGGR